MKSGAAEKSTTRGVIDYLAEKNSYKKGRVRRNYSYRKERLSREKVTGGTGDLERGTVGVLDIECYSSSRLRIPCIVLLMIRTDR